MADHLRRRPFVADVLLYDTLVVPIPEDGRDALRWHQLRRQPERQAALLDILGDHALPVRWTEQHRQQFAARHGGDKAHADADESTPERDRMAAEVAADVGRMAQAREIGRRNPNPDDPDYLTTRIILADQFGSAADRSITRQIPWDTEVESVVAYGSYNRFEADRGRLADDPHAGQPVYQFSWKFLVPSGSDRTDEDLLREAVELSNTDDIRDWRHAVQQWRYLSIRKGQSDDQARKDMEDMIKAYAAEARKRRIRVAARYGFAIAAAAAGGLAAAIVAPPAGMAAAAFSLGALIPHKNVPQQYQAAAMFYEARRRLD